MTVRQNWRGQTDGCDRLVPNNMQIIVILCPSHYVLALKCMIEGSLVFPAILWPVMEREFLVSSGCQLDELRLP